MKLSEKIILTLWSILTVANMVYVVDMHAKLIMWVYGIFNLIVVMSLTFGAIGALRKRKQIKKINEFLEEPVDPKELE